MGLFGKLKEILFDEETVEIPVITKDEEEAKAPKKKVKVEEIDEKTKRLNKIDDDVIIEKIETPKRHVKTEEDTFDMPKLKEEAREERRSSNFTFPIFGDDEKEIVTEKRSNSTKKVVALKDEEEEVEKKKQPAKEARRESGFTNAYDYSYGKYKGDYKSSRESNHELITKSLEMKEERKAFTPSPIISPVYGVLNENYKKEDIKSKNETKIDYDKNRLDLDSVRRKAYGTLEDEIEISLSKPEEQEETFEIKDEEVEILNDEGISINDLLIDSESDESNEEIIEEAENNQELLEEAVDEQFDMEEEVKDKQNEEDIIPPSHKIGVAEAREERKPIPRKERSVSPVKKDESVHKEAIGEEDLFDLIDSLYEGKDEE